MTTIVAFIEVDHKVAADLELETGMSLYFIRSAVSGLTRIYYKFFNDIDSATEFFFVKHKLRIIPISSYSRCLMKFAYDLQTINVYDVENVFSTIESYELLEKLER
jgi:hypothetical protein